MSYATGLHCTWHGPLEGAGRRAQDDAPVCPVCSGLLSVWASEAMFWERVRSLDRAVPRHEDRMHWSQGKCFPDPETMINAWLQATEE